MKRDRYRKLRRTLRVEPQKPGTQRARPLSSSVSNVPTSVQRYSYQMSIRRLAIRMRGLSRRLRNLETQLSRGKRALMGTKDAMDNSENIGGGLMWWATDENVLYVHDDADWQLSKATQVGTTSARDAASSMGEGQLLMEDIAGGLLLEDNSSNLFLEDSDYSPVVVGSLWWDTTLEELFIWNGFAWDDIDVAHAGVRGERNAYPQTVGDLWWDTTEEEWYADAGNEWQVMNPSVEDAFRRLPALLHYVPSSVQHTVNIVPYTDNNWRTNPIQSASGSALALYAWTRPKFAANNEPLISEWQDNDYFYSLEQVYDVFLFGVSPDGTKANRKIALTYNIDYIDDSWHFLAGLYKPGKSIKLFHNGVWYRYVGVVPGSRYFEYIEWNYLEINYKDVSPIGHNSNFNWAVCGIGTAAPTEELVEYVYYSTKGLFL